MLKTRKFLKLIQNEIIYGGHLLSLGAVSIVFTSAILLNIKITWDCLVIVYLGIYSTYLFNRYKELRIDISTNPERTLYLQKHIKYIPFIISFSALLMIVILVFFNKTSIIIFGLILFLISLLYSIFLKEFTKKIIGFKNYFVSLMWTLLIIFLAVYYSFSLNISIFLIIGFVYLKLFIHETISDIKDIESDEKEKLVTFPMIFEKKKLLQILTLIAILAGVPIVLGFYLNLFPIYSLMLLLTIPYNVYCFGKLKNRNVEFTFLYNILVDGEFILWSFFILLGKFLL